MLRSVVTYTCDNNCGTTANVEFVRDQKRQGDVPLPEYWLDIIAVDNVGQIKTLGGQFCPECVDAMRFALMEVKLQKEFAEQDAIVESNKVKPEDSLLLMTNPTKSPTTKMIASILEKNVNANKIVDISPGVEKLFNVSRVKFNAAVKDLRDEGYQVFKRIKTQVGTNKKVNLTLLAVQGVNYKEVYDAEITKVKVTRKELNQLSEQTK